MKKILLTMAFVLTALGDAWADDVTVDNITIPKGSSATLKIYLENISQYRQQFQFDLELPNGITVLTGTEKLNSVRFQNKTADPASLRCEQQSSSDPNKSIVRFLAKEDDDDLIEGSEGIIMTVQLLAASTLDKGVALTGNITGIEVTTHDSQAFRPSNKSFNITIGEPLEQVILDENSTVVPAAQSNVDVVVYRTIKANVWSTICLPFDMSSSQVKSAFGEDVELADMTGWSVTGANFDVSNPAGSNPTVQCLNIEFSSVSAITKNHPYLIKFKGTDDITSFAVKNVIISPTNNPKVNVELEGGCIGQMIGTYKSGGYVPNKNIFLNQETFYRTQNNKTTTIKGYRAYFCFYYNEEEEDDEGELVSKKRTIIIDETSSSRITMSFNDDATKIKDVRASEDDGSVYNLSGQKVERLNKKGLYIKSGKKVVIK